MSDFIYTGTFKELGTIEIDLAEGLLILKRFDSVCGFVDVTSLKKLCKKIVAGKIEKHRNECERLKLSGNVSTETIIDFYESLFKFVKEKNLTNLQEST